MKATPTGDLPVVLETDQFIGKSVFKTHSLNLSSDCFVINLYKNGSHSCGAHADDEPMIDQRFAIYLLSLGATRTMTIERKYKKSSVLSILYHT